MKKILGQFALAALLLQQQSVLAFIVPSSQSSRHSSVLHASIDETEARVDNATTATPQHPHGLLWDATLESSKNSHASPSIELATQRPPAEGGTGIVATADLPKDSIALSLSLSEVGIIDASSILDGYDEEKEHDAVFAALKQTWTTGDTETAARDKQASEQGKRLAVLAGCLAHLQLTRYKDKTGIQQHRGHSHAFNESRRLGLFLDAMPLMPTTVDGSNPFPTHCLFWSDDEIENLLRGTFGLTKARENRAGIELVVRQWSPFFLAEHSPALAQAQILDGIFSAFASVMSRSFGDDRGRDLDGLGRMLVPLVDMLNHDSEEPNVGWEVVDAETDRKAGDVVVTALRDIKKGEELLKCYGWRPAWDIAASYGFVPALKKERWECAVIPLFPSLLDLGDGTTTAVDLTLEANYGPLVRAVLAAVDAANEIKARQQKNKNTGGKDDNDDGRPDQLKRLEIVSLFRPSSNHPDPAAFPRIQPCVVVGTKIFRSDTEAGDNNASSCHEEAIESVLPAFRAAASAIEQLRRQNKEGKPIEASKMAMAAALLDTGSDWNKPALQLIDDGIEERIRTLTDGGRTADSWLSKASGSEGDHRRLRAGVAKDARRSELDVLAAIQAFRDRHRNIGVVL